MNWKKLFATHILEKRRKKRNIDNLQIEQDENFSFIAGYTSGGFPYGNHWEETDDDQNEVEDVFI